MLYFKKTITMIAQVMCTIKVKIKINLKTWICKKIQLKIKIERVCKRITYKMKKVKVDL
jgi:hypothetical protein